MQRPAGLVPPGVYHCRKALEAGVAAFGKAQGRIEDPRLLTGQGRYVDDIAPPGALRAVFLRSAVAHGRITVLDVGAARAAPGVHLVLTAADLRAQGVTWISIA
jgi:carbon-monoxide dehydrogenase large subunit